MAAYSSRASFMSLSLYFLSDSLNTMAVDASAATIWPPKSDVPVWQSQYISSALWEGPLQGSKGPIQVSQSTQHGALGFHRRVFLSQKPY